MDFNELLNVIAQIKKKIICPNCQKKYTNHNIHVLGTSRFEGSLYVKCAHCKAPMLVSVQLPHIFTTDLKNFSFEFEPIDDKGAVSENDILDMHNFLSKLQGEDITKFMN